MTKRKIVYHDSPEKLTAWRKRMRRMHRLGREPEVGEMMHDGTVFVGISPDTGKRFFAMPKDALCTQFNKAAEHLKLMNGQKALGYSDWRLPTLEEMRVLYDACDEGKLSGTFNRTYHAVTGWYWTSTLNTRHDGCVQHWQKSFFEGKENYFDGNFTAMTRFVRG